MSGRQARFHLKKGGGGGGEAEMTLWLVIFEDCMKHVYSQVNTFLLRTSSCHEPKSRSQQLLQNRLVPRFTKVDWQGCGINLHMNKAKKAEAFM